MSVSEATTEQQVISFDVLDRYCSSPQHRGDITHDDNPRAEIEGIFPHSSIR